VMPTERVLLKTDAQGNLVGIPKLPPNINLEVIFLLLDRRFITQVERQPPPILKGSVTISDDLLEPIMSDEEWDDSLDRTVRQIVRQEH